MKKVYEPPDHIQFRSKPRNARKLGAAWAYMERKSEEKTETKTKQEERKEVMRNKENKKELAVLPR